MLFTEARTLAARAAADVDQALTVLRRMALDDFGQLLLETEEYPALRAVLPEMPPDAIQAKWNGRSGESLLTQSVAFMRAVETLHARFCNRSMFGRRFLDYGCGWGRLLRLALYYSDSEKLHGVDAWEESLALCREHRVPGTLKLIDPAPQKIDVPVGMDVGYAFSIFTHLPEQAFRAALTAVRPHVAQDGIFVFTVRPVEYWSVHQDFWQRSREELISEHLARGFAFQSHDRPDALFGDTSMSNAFVERALRDAGWSTLGFDRMLVDPMQVIVAARPA